MTGRVLSLGSVNVDFQVRIERWPEPGETLLGRDFIRIGGGKAANVAWLAQRLGADAALFAHVGDDDLAPHALRPLEDSGVRLEHVRRVAGQRTAVSMIMTRADGDKSIVLAPNANESWTEEDADDVARRVSQAPMGAVLVADLEVPAFVVRRAAEAAQARRLRVVLDPSPASRVDDALLACASYATPNLSEAAQLVGSGGLHGVDDAKKAAVALCRRGLEAALIKLGPLGFVVADGEGVDHFEGIPVEAVDTTGAGDAFAAALAVGLVEERPLRTAACFAHAASTLAVTGWGSRPAYPDRGQVERLLARMRRAT